MRLRLTTFTAIAFLLTALPASAQTITRSFSASAGGTLELQLEAGGHVIITGGASEVSAEIDRSGRDADELEVTFDTRGSRIVVTSGFEYHNDNDADVTYEFRVPSRFNIELELTGGGVEISGVNGSIRGQTMGGGLTLSDLAGDIDFQTMGGSIRLRDSELSGKVHTMGGEISVTNVEGDVEASTMGGDVTFRGVRPAGETEMRVSTMGGNIRVEDAPAGANVHTMGGDIRVGEVGEYLKAKTMGGDIDIAGVDGWIEAETMGGDIEARIIGGRSGDRHVDLSSRGGDIELTLPANLSVEFDIQVVIDSSKDPRDYEIESDFELDVTVPRELRRGRRTRLTATGSRSGGDNLVRIRTTNGNVRIYRSN